MDHAVRDVSARRAKRAIARAQRAQVLRVLRKLENICARLASFPKFARAQISSILGGIEAVRRHT